MIVYEEKMKIAERIITEKKHIVQELLEKGYVFYDQFEVTNAVARDIKSMLNKKYGNDEMGVHSLEDNVNEEGVCGIIYINKILEDQTENVIYMLKEKIQEHYGN